MLRVNLQGWYWTPENELRQCLVVEVWDGVSVIDAETLDPDEVDPSDIMIEQPEA